MSDTYTRSFDTNTLLALVAVTLFVFPVVRLAGLPIPSIALFAVFAYPFNFDRKFLILVLFAGSYIALVSGIHLAADRFAARDALYFSIFGFYLLIYLALSGILTQSDPDRFLRLLKIGLVCEIGLLFLQRLNAGSINEILEFSWAALSQHIANASLHGSLTIRPFGTFGNPTYAGFAIYMLARTIYVWDGKQRWLLFGLIGVVLTTARMALLAFVLFEALAVFLRARPRLKMLIVILLAFLAWAAVQILVALYERGFDLPFSVRIVAQFALGMYDIQEDYSFSYRLSMIEWVRENRGLLSFGGMGSEDFPKYVDSELILRSLQFGIVGFAFIQATWLFESKRLGSTDGLFLIFITLAGSVTNTIATNVFFVVFLLIYHRVLVLSRSESSP